MLNSTDLNFKIMDNPSGDFSRKYRHISKGGWAFQVADQGWQVSDCTAEALKVQYLPPVFLQFAITNEGNNCSIPPTLDGWVYIGPIHGPLDGPLYIWAQYTPTPTGTHIRG